MLKGAKPLKTPPLEFDGEEDASNLEDYSTADLSAELGKRKGVTKFIVSNDESFILKIFNGENHRKFTGPAIILINQD